jgi:PKD domain-containing protein
MLPLNSPRNGTKILLLAFAIGAVVVGATALGGCGGNGKDNGGRLSATANADPFAGPAPLAVRFTAAAKNAFGKARYHWRFDDGTASNSQNPAHSFPRPGYYLVIVDVFDQSGNNTRQSLLLGVWGAREWAESQRVRLTRKRAIRAQKRQQKRTAKRREALNKQLRKDLAGALQ